jgi:hypothetical protein
MPELIGEGRTFYSDYAREKVENRRKRIYESFNLQNDLKNFILKYIPDIEEVREKYLNVTDEPYADIKTLSQLLEIIENRIGYLAEKSHDSEEDEEYVERLRILHDKLFDKITSPS